MTWAVPVVKDDSSLARYTARAAISSARPRRPMGWRSTKLATYLCTSFQLAWAFPDPVGGISASLLKFGGIFALTQIPLAISEGLLTVLVVNAMARFNAAELQGLPLFARRGVQA